jgi:putative ABC transport system permease protein
VAIGLIGVWATTRILESMVTGSTPWTPITIIGGSVAMAVVAILASAIPAARAVNVPPIIALRSE